MRLPLVLIITNGMPRALAARTKSMICGWMVGSPPENCTTSGLPSVRTKSSRICSTSSSVRLKPGAGVGEAERAVHVAGAVDLDDAQAGVLLMVGAEAAIVRAAVARCSGRRRAGWCRAC